MYDKESYPKLATLVEPSHLICTIGGFIMSDPVTIETGRTYDRSSITMFFKYAQDAGQICYCPVTL